MIFLVNINSIANTRYDTVCFLVNFFGICKGIYTECQRFQSWFIKLLICFSCVFRSVNLFVSNLALTLPSFSLRPNKRLFGVRICSILLSCKTPNGCEFNIISTLQLIKIQCTFSQCFFKQRVTCPIKHSQNSLYHRAFANANFYEKFLLLTNCYVVFTSNGLPLSEYNLSTASSRN